MSLPKSSDLAFPSPTMPDVPGLTKRELFAALAIHGMLAHPGTCSSNYISDRVGVAYKHADELLRQGKEGR